MGETIPEGATKAQVRWPTAESPKPENPNREQTRISANQREPKYPPEQSQAKKPNKDSAP